MPGGGGMGGQYGVAETYQWTRSTCHPAPTPSSPTSLTPYPLLTRASVATVSVLLFRAGAGSTGASAGVRGRVRNPEALGV